MYHQGFKVSIIRADLTGEIFLRWTSDMAYKFHCCWFSNTLWRVLVTSVSTNYVASVLAVCHAPWAMHTLLSFSSIWSFAMFMRPKCLSLMTASTFRKFKISVLFLLYLSPFFPSSRQSLIIWFPSFCWNMTCSLICRRWPGVCFFCTTLFELKDLLYSGTRRAFVVFVVDNCKVAGFFVATCWGLVCLMMKNQRVVRYNIEKSSSLYVHHTMCSFPLLGLFSWLNGLDFYECFGAAFV